MLVAATLFPVGAGVGVAWAHLCSLMMASAKTAERDIASAFISTLQLIAQAFTSAFAGMIANLAGFADPKLGAAGVMRSVMWLFLVFSLLPAAALPVAIRAVRQPCPRVKRVDQDRRRRGDVERLHPAAAGDRHDLVAGGESGGVETLLLVAEDQRRRLARR